MRKFQTLSFTIGAFFPGNDVESTLVTCLKSLSRTSLVCVDRLVLAILGDPHLFYLSQVCLKLLERFCGHSKDHLLRLVVFASQMS